MNAYARYEQGASVPTIDKLTELLRALEPDADFVLRKSGIHGHRRHGGNPQG